MQHISADAVPPSSQLSSAARNILAQMKVETAPAAIAGNLAQQRAFYGAWNDRRLAEMNRAFATIDTRSEIGGVPVDVVTPQGGIALTNRNRVLINVHGGAFMWGAGSGALVEAIPIAATGRIKVVTVDYRLAPEHTYPAASEDVAAVYRALLDEYPAANIGIYGCSAGGIITAQATAWFAAHGLPRPGAIGTFCGTGAPYSGDSPYLSAFLGREKMPPPAGLPKQTANPYLIDVPRDDCTAYPLTCDATTAAMPPTLLLAGGRDFAASALTLAHRRLAAAGVKSELYLFDGLPHAFFMWPDMPESHEAFARIVDFFDRHLGRAPRAADRQ
ncbi:alpha/beta hydrolase [Altererythrobacter sp. N1]|nr:alpha/beta hydrolase [Altererythrobacter sp. N1]